MDKTFYGKYRATVLNNIDPEQKGRLMLTIPDVLGEMPSSWAECCTPLAGPTGFDMGTYMVPPIGTGVWVEFEQGDPNFPIWVGCRWGSQADVPPDATLGSPATPNIVIQSMLKHKIVLSDLLGPTGGITITSLSGASIKINDLGITIDNGLGAKIELKGPSIDMNNGALKII